MASLAVDIGQVLDERFELESVLGRGGFGMVYKARQVSTGQPVAIKVLQRDKLVADGEDFSAEVARFQREMELIGQLKHPNIVRLIDSGRLSDGQVFIVLEYIEGETLAELIDREGGLHPRDATRVMTQVLEALSCAHDQGIVHRDLKPQNIMVTTSGARHSALVLDFGIAAVIEGSRGKDYRTLTATGQFHGTPCYMAPEQLREKKLTQQTDIYAWGLVFLEALTGYPAVIAESFAEIIYLQMAPTPVTIPQAVLEHPLGPIIQRAVHKSLDRRYPDVNSVLADLEDCRGDVAFKLPLYTTAETPDLDAMLATTGAVIPDYDLADTGKGDGNPASGPSPVLNLDTGDHDDIADEPEAGDDLLGSDSELALDAPPVNNNRTPWIVAAVLGVLLLGAVGWNLFGLTGAEKDPVPPEDLAARNPQAAADSKLPDKAADDPGAKPTEQTTQTTGIKKLPIAEADAPLGTANEDRSADSQDTGASSNEPDDSVQSKEPQKENLQQERAQEADNSVGGTKLQQVVAPQEQMAVRPDEGDGSDANNVGMLTLDNDNEASFDNMNRTERDNKEKQANPENKQLLGDAAQQARQTAEKSDGPAETSEKRTNAKSKSKKKAASKKTAPQQQVQAFQKAR